MYISVLYSSYINYTLENGLTVRNISIYYNKFFIFYGTLPSDPSNFIKLFLFCILNQQDIL
jgi:hypothetical protein